MSLYRYLVYAGAADVRVPLQESGAAQGQSGLRVHTAACGSLLLSQVRQLWGSLSFLKMQWTLCALPNCPSSLLDRHRFDADPDSDLTFHFNADRDPNPDPTSSQLENQNFFYFHSQQFLVTFIFLVIVISVIIFRILVSMLTFTRKSLHLVEFNTYSEPPKLCRSDRIRIRIRIHNSVSVQAGRDFTSFCCNLVLFVPKSDQDPKFFKSWIWICLKLTRVRTTVTFGYQGRAAVIGIKKNFCSCFPPLLLLIFTACNVMW